MRPRAWVGIGVVVVATGVIVYGVVSLTSASATPRPLPIGLPTHRSVVNGVTIKGKLPSLPSRAIAYRFPPQPATPLVNALADALGVHGSPVRNGNAISIQDGQRQVSIGPGGWKLFILPNPSSTVPPPTPPVDAPPVVPRAVAEGVARHVLAIAGAPRQVGIQLMARFGEWQVDGALSLSGIPVESYVFDLRVGAGGTVEDGMGMLGAPRRLDAYPLIDVRDALAKLSHGDDGFAHYYPLKEPFHSVTVTNAELRYVFAGDGTWLVPAFRFPTEGYYGPQFALAVHRRYVTNQRAGR